VTLGSVSSERLRRRSGTNTCGGQKKSHRGRKGESSAAEERSGRDLGPEKSETKERHG